MIQYLDGRPHTVNRQRLLALRPLGGVLPSILYAMAPVGEFRREPICVTNVADSCEIRIQISLNPYEAGAGLDPADAEARFVVSIVLEGGHPVITWSPNVSGRQYTVEGTEELSDALWQECDPENIPESMHFFRVKVALP